MEIHSMGSQSKKSSFSNEEKNPVVAESIIDTKITKVTSEDNVDDPEELADLGYKQEFRRQLSLFGIFSIAFSVLGLLPSVASTLSFSLSYVGTPGLLWAWLIAIFFLICIALSMAEICSALPTSGGLYYAAAVFAPEGWGPLASWITGWSNYIGNVIGQPSVNSSAASMILGAVSINRSSYSPTNYQVFLLSVGIQCLHCFLASLPTRYISKINRVNTFINILFLFIAAFAIIGYAAKNDKFNHGTHPWREIKNTTNWPDGFAVLLSFNGAIWTMSGYDAPFHLSEECAKASVNAPKAIVLTAVIGGIVGWLMQVLVSYTIVDVHALITGSGNMWSIYLSQVMPKSAAIAILSLTIFSTLMMGQSSLIASSRIAYSYARDGILPFSGWIGKVNNQTKTPVNAVICNGIISICILFLLFAGDETSSAVFSVGAVAAFSAFTIPIFIRVFCMKDSEFHRGPWNLGRYSRPIGALACAFVALMIPVLCFPNDKNPSPKTMNWTCLVYGGPIFLTLIWYAISARKWFKGPKASETFKGESCNPSSIPEFFEGKEK
ncbi:amino acid transmembrane transporter [Schizosaccharomyces osmophilus]|uniref:Amino acid transmembrane transporter n=1 Tax=Schizosaccharomyces osmophilus TaxID=2545709 RepID=A0AAF0AZQ4_9SCHI|nr:amino acid transmembrane transporter [Schizosaccharomyces osmophilus]WBW75288.1 amino acid transmembrane transporter [Schizosaccharomyces osmophilus]